MKRGIEIIRKPGPAVLLVAVWLAMGCGGDRDPGRSNGPSSAGSAPVRVGNYHAEAPYGIAIIVGDRAAFLLDPLWDEAGGKTIYSDRDKALIPPGTAAPDFSIFETEFRHRGARIRWSWGRIGDKGVGAVLSTDRPVRLAFRLSPGWPRFNGVFEAAEGGIDGFGIAADGEYIPFALRCRPGPALIEADMAGEGRLYLDLEPGGSAVLALGIGVLPSLEEVEGRIVGAREAYAARRISAAGDWGDFAGAIADNLNTSRLYGSDNGRIAHSLGRGWWMFRGNPDHFPYFAWDLFFHAVLSGLEDPGGARDTIRAVLSYATPSGFIPGYSHWDYEGDFVSFGRSQPPVGAFCVWMLHERWPETDFLAEVYPALVRWHDWWPTARDGNGNGLLEWGSGKKIWQGAQWETGWDDNVHFEGTEMVGTAMNADAVDLNAMWSLDAEYLGKIAAALGRTADRARFEAEHAAMNRRINERLWNEDLGVYCSRFWDIPAVAGPALEPKEVFPEGLATVFFNDRDLGVPILERRDRAIDFDWGEGSPAPGVHENGWSARWTGVLRVPRTGEYRIRTRSDDGVRVFLDGRIVIDDWRIHWQEPKHADLTLEGGRDHLVVVEYFDHARMASLRLSVHPVSPGGPGDDWLTRVTPMNLYPLICGAPDTARAERVLGWLYRPDKFWIERLVPSVAVDDPAWPQQSYWRGHVWPPANYLLWQGLKRYGEPHRLQEFARRSVELFMRNWIDRRECGENYRSTDGRVGDHPHYTWGALLCLIGLEALAEAGPDLSPVAGSLPGLTGNITVRRIPFGGKLYAIEAGEEGIKVRQEK